MTDHGPTNEQKAGPFLELEVGEALSEPPSSGSRHHNGCVIIAGGRLRNLCAFQRFVPDATVERTVTSAERALYVAVHPDGASQAGLHALLRLTGMPARVPTAD